MRLFSANLGFLWTELPLPDAIRAAANAGFDAVECHWPYETAPQLVAEALNDTGLKMLGLNTVRGKAGENGLSALPGREDEAKSAIDQAIAYAVAIDAANVHVMAGFADGPDAQAVFLENLTYACEQASIHEITILVEPLNQKDAPGYFLKDSHHAADIISQVNRENLKMMFDCYHIQIIEGDALGRLRDTIEIIGHVQIASVPQRAEPNIGELDYSKIYETLDDLGYAKPIGAEYRPQKSVEEGLDWLAAAR